jgi:CRP/FNR family cyclic AMP-dependent transcriptional regulator
MFTTEFASGWPFKPVKPGARVSGEELVRREAALAQAPLFSGLSKRQLRSLARVTGVSGYEQGSEVVKEGAGGWTFYVILDGQAKAVRGGRTIGRLRAGDFFGEISVLDGGPRTATVVAERPLRCLTLARDDLLEVMESDSRLAATILREVAKRLRQTQRSFLS